MSKILLVDDDADVRAAVAMVLEMDGHSCASFANAREALEWYDQNKADVIILDQMMPGLTGAECGRVLRSKKDLTPIIFLSADRAIEQSVDDVEASRVVKKPFDVDELLTVVQSFSATH